MAAFARSAPQIDIPERIQEDGEPVGTNAVVKLALLHAEAEETARLANLLGRSLYVAASLPIFALLTLGFSNGISTTRALVWCAFVAAGSLGMFRSYRHTIGQPFERIALKSFARDMSPMLLYAGFAWGSGAFLALPAATNMIAAITFVAVPAIAIAVMLREREAAYLFLAPAALLAAFASVLVPFAGGVLASALILIASGAIAAVMMFSERRQDVRPAMLTLT